MDKVEVYFHSRKRLFSVRDAKTKKVIKHTDLIFLEDCEFVVQDSGRKRVLTSGVKNVHAWVKGTETKNLRCFNHSPLDVTYNPRKNDSFVVANSLREWSIDKADYVIMRVQLYGSQIWAYNDIPSK